MNRVTNQMLAKVYLFLGNRKISEYRAFEFRCTKETLFKKCMENYKIWIAAPDFNDDPSYFISADFPGCIQINQVCKNPDGTYNVPIMFVKIVEN